MEALLQNPEAFREMGFFWTFVLVIIAACVYFAPIIKQWLKTRIEGQKRTDQIIENCTAAINNNSEALRNNSEALRDNLADRDQDGRHHPASMTARATCAFRSRTLL